MYIKLLFQEKWIDVFRNLNVSPCYYIDPPVSIQIISVQKNKKVLLPFIFCQCQNHFKVDKHDNNWDLGPKANLNWKIENFESEHVIICQFLVDNIDTVVSVRI